MGNDAGRYITSGDYNTCLGRYAGGGITTGNRNVAIGPYSLWASVTGADNVAVGYEALTQLTSGNYNVCLGYRAGRALTDQQKFVAIGYSAEGGGLTSNTVLLYNGTNNASFSQSATSWTFASDQRDKTDFQNLGLGLDFLKKITPRQFKWNYRNPDGKLGNGAVNSGFIAQEVLAVCEEEGFATTVGESVETGKIYTGLVSKEDPDFYTVANAEFIPMLVKQYKNYQLKTMLWKHESLHLNQHD